MILFVIAYLGGVVSILSPCILPVLPFVFARADRSFARSTLPMLTGMAVTFAAIASLAAVGGNWAVQANTYGRVLAMGLMTVFGLALLSSRLATRLAAPLVSLGNRLSDSAATPDKVQTLAGPLLLGAATGLLWAPCAGPILGLVLTGAALQGANAESSLLLLCYSAGAATSLAVALLLGGKVFAALKSSLGAGEWLRRGLGAAVLLGVATVASGADTRVLARWSNATSGKLEQVLVDASGVQTARVGEASADGRSAAARPFVSDLPVEGQLPSLDGAVSWLNSPPLTREQLRGKVVLVDFWTYSCINCIRTLPYIRAWSAKYASQGLVVIGVHAPEFAFEKKIDNVKRAVDDFKIDFPVAIDNDFRIWRAFANNAWPAYYLVDATGRIRYHQLGEGRYKEAEKAIQDLLAEAGSQTIDMNSVVPESPGAQAAPDLRNLRSGETYLGARQATNFASPGGLKPSVPSDYTGAKLRADEWSLTGNWTVLPDQATVNRPDGAIAYRFNARDLHLVIGPGLDGKPVRFEVTVDGRAPGRDHGADIDEAGRGTITQTRLHQLVRQADGVRERLFEIRCLDPGAAAYAFTFG